MAPLKALKDDERVVGPLRPPSFAHAINNPTESYLAPLRKAIQHARKVANTTPRPYFNKRGEELLKTQFAAGKLSDKEKAAVLSRRERK